MGHQRLGPATHLEESPPASKGRDGAPRRSSLDTSRVPGSRLAEGVGFDRLGVVSEKALVMASHRVSPGRFGSNRGSNAASGALSFGEMRLVWFIQLVRGKALRVIESTDDPFPAAQICRFYEHLVANGESGESTSEVAGEVC